MKKLFLFLFAGSVFLTSCKDDKASVEETALNFMNAVGKADFGEAAKYCDEPTGKLLESVKSFAEMGKSMGGKVEKKAEKKIKITKSEIKEETAVVFYKEEGNDKEQQVELKKIKGDWKVSMNKEKMNKEKNKEGMQDGLKSIDSIGKGVEKGLEDATKTLDSLK